MKEKLTIYLQKARRVIIFKCIFEKSNLFLKVSLTVNKNGVFNAIMLQEGNGWTLGRATAMYFLL